MQEDNWIALAPYDVVDLFAVDLHERTNRRMAPFSETTRRDVNHRQQCSGQNNNKEQLSHRKPSFWRTASSNASPSLQFHDGLTAAGLDRPAVKSITRLQVMT
jgi:hypothetical protein